MVGSSKKNPGSKKKASDEQILESYGRLKNVWKVAEEFSMCGQSVHERLKRLKYEFIDRNYSDEEVQKIKDFYLKSTDCQKDGLKNLAKSMGKDHHNLCRKARELGLTNKNRKKSKELCDLTSKNMKTWMQKNPHPKGMLGKNHSKEFCEKQAIRFRNFLNNMPESQRAAITLKSLQTREKNGTLITKDQKVSWKQGWRIIGGKNIYFRSRWEANYGRYLEFLKKNNQIKEWEHEPKTFWFLEIMRGCRSYLPDFRITNLDGSQYWVEVKGWYDDRSLTKIKRFKKYYPEEKLELIDAKWYGKNKNKLSGIIDGWELDSPQKPRYVKKNIAIIPEQ